MDQLLTSYEMQLLGIYAKQEGRNWRSRLRLLWERGTYDGFDRDSIAVFQTIRNKIGPSGLDRIKFGEPLAGKGEDL